MLEQTRTLSFEFRLSFFLRDLFLLSEMLKKKHILKRKRRECLRSKFEMNQICIKSIFSPNAFHESKATSLDIQIICEIDRNESSSIFFSYFAFDWNLWHVCGGRRPMRAHSVWCLTDNDRHMRCHDCIDSMQSWCWWCWCVIPLPHRRFCLFIT